MSGRDRKDRDIWGIVVGLESPEKDKSRVKEYRVRIVTDNCSTSPRVETPMTFKITSRDEEKGQECVVGS